MLGFLSTLLYAVLIACFCCGLKLSFFSDLFEEFIDENCEFDEEDDDEDESETESDDSDAGFNSEFRKYKAHYYSDKLEFKRVTP